MSFGRPVRRPLGQLLRFRSFEDMDKNAAVIRTQLHRSRRRSIGRQRHVSVPVAAPNRWCISSLARGLSCTLTLSPHELDEPFHILQRGSALFRALPPFLSIRLSYPAADVATGTPHSC
jgi:hypothetical protein